MRDRFLRALRGEPVDAVPIWLMRQAGRHLPGYRALRADHGILDIARDPELAARVTLEPLERFDLDAGVIFADITIPFLGLGVEYSIDAGIGPVVRHPIRSLPDVEGIRTFVANRDAGFVSEAIRRVREQRSDLPIIGFAGAPFTLAGYLVEGGASREYGETKRLLLAQPGVFRRLLRILTEATINYLQLQVRAGAHALQLFDSWVGHLSRAEYEREILPSLQEIFQTFDDSAVPTIYFSTGSTHLLDLAARTGAQALSVDWRLPLGRVRRLVGDRITLQGNLDPVALRTDRATLYRLAREVLDELPDHRGHVFNLGHGVPPDARPENVEALVEFVHRYASGGP